MKSSAFGDQARQVAAWFQEWNQCEQTIALYSLLSKVSATQARFLCLVLEHTLKNGNDSQELTRMETDANNPVFLSAMHSETEDTALQHLLSHILLLHPGNSKAREEYLKLLPKVLFGSEDVDYLYKCRQLLSLALVHPAFPHDDREKLTFWLSRLDDKCRKISERSTTGVGHQSYYHFQSASLPHLSPQSSPPRKIYQINTGSSDDSSRSNTLNGSNRIYITLPQTSSGFTLNGFGSMGEIDTYPFDEDDEPVQKGFTQYGRLTLPLPEHCHTPDSFDDYVRTRSKGKSLTLPIARPPSACSLPPTLDDQPVPGFLKAGMRDVPIWLKTLRLHKYQHLFADMSYEELLSTTEDYLESKNVTKGARNKIILSIRKLQKRQETLAEIDQDIEKTGKLLSCITELRQILLTPIKTYSSSSDISSVSTSGNGSDDKDSNQHTTPGAGDDISSSSQDNSPCHEGNHRDDGSSGGSSCSTPPSSPRLNRSSSISSIDDLLAKDFPQSDLPSLILRSIGKVFNQLMMHTETNEENLSAFIRLLGNALCHESFKVSHKKLFLEWKQQCQQTLQVISPKKSPRNRGLPSSFTIGGSPQHPKVTFERPRMNRRINGRGSTLGSKSGVTMIGSPRSPSTLPRATPRQIQLPLPPPYYPPRSRTSSLSTVPPPPIPPSVRAHRYVNLTIPSPVEVSEMYMEETHELCKSVTEHALEDHTES